MTVAWEKEGDDNGGGGGGCSVVSIRASEIFFQMGKRGILVIVEGKMRKAK